MTCIKVRLPQDNEGTPIHLERVTKTNYGRIRRLHVKLDLKLSPKF